MDGWTLERQKEKRAGKHPEKKEREERFREDILPFRVYFGTLCQIL
jgi:hypothetical protein